MDRHFTAQQLAAAPAAWMPNGRTAKVRVVDSPPVSLKLSGPMAASTPLHTRDIECPVISEEPEQVVVVMPDGQRLALRR